jgi:hypothetical protein
VKVGVVGGKKGAGEGEGDGEGEGEGLERLKMSLDVETLR